MPTGYVLITRFWPGENGFEPGFGSSQAACRHAYSLTVLRRDRFVQVDRFRESLLPVLGRQMWWGSCLNCDFWDFEDGL